MRTLPSYNGVAGSEPQSTARKDIHMAEYTLSQVNPSGHTTSGTTASPGHVHSSGAAESQKLKCPCQGPASIVITVLSPQINATPTS